MTNTCREEVRIGGGYYSKTQLGPSDPQCLHNVAGIAHRGVEHGAASHLTRGVDDQELTFCEATDHQEVLIARVMGHGEHSEGDRRGTEALK